MPVYMIQAEGGGPVKIGWANDPSERLGVLQTAHYQKLVILRLIDGPQTIERWLHAHFRPQQVRGEWFLFTPDMLSIEPSPDHMPRRRAVGHADELLTPQDVERLAADAGISVSEVCRRAGIAHSTFTRWRKGDTEPTLDVYRRICGAIRNAGTEAV